MTIDANVLEKIDALHDEGRDFVESGQIHGAVAEYEFDTCRFDKWRRKANDLLYVLGGCDDLYYQRFSKQVLRPHVKDLEVGLRILSAVRDDVSSKILRERTGKACPEKGCSRPSAGFD